jgi:hypothetical protein
LGLPEVPNQEAKVIIQWFKSQNSMLIQVYRTINMVDHVMKRGSIVKVDNVSKSIRHCSYDLHFKTVVIKHAEQTTVNQQQNTVSPEADI